MTIGDDTIFIVVAVVATWPATLLPLFYQPKDTDLWTFLKNKISKFIWIKLMAILIFLLFILFYILLLLFYFYLIQLII